MITTDGIIYLKFNDYLSSLSFKMRLNDAPELAELYKTGIVGESCYSVISNFTIEISLYEGVTKNHLQTVLETLARLCLFCTGVKWISITSGTDSRDIGYMDLVDCKFLESFEL